MSVQQQLSDRYQIGEEIGFGGMSEVYLAVDKRLQREVAVKILKAELASDRVFYLRFKRETENAAGLSHPNIAQVFDAGEIPENIYSVPYIVMEYVDGETLREILNREQRINPTTSLHWISEVCDALQYSHVKGIIHRDMKPANIMIDHAGTVKVVDFGIARAITDISRDLTQTSTVIGTARYLSPEQATGKPVDARSDLYALGCVLFELLTGRPPFSGDTPVAVAYQHVREQPPLPSQLNPEISPEIDALVMKALSKNPQNRYQNALEMRQDIISVLSGGKPTAPMVLGKFEEYSFDPHASSADIPTQDYPPVSMDPRRGIWLKVGATIAVAAVLAAVAGITSWVMRTVDPSPHSQVAVVSVPANLFELNVGEAKIRLRDLGFNTSTSLTSQCDSSNYNHIINSSPTPGSPAPDRNLTIYVCQPPDASINVLMPDVINKDTNTATSLIQNLHLDRPPLLEITSQFDDTIPEGKVIHTDPPAGSLLNQQNSRITLYISKGKGPKVLPDMVGTQLDPTRKELMDLKIKVSVIMVDYLKPYNEIIDSTANTGADSDKVHLITLHVSTGKAKMPQLVDQTPEQAQNIMNDQGYNGRIIPMRDTGLLGTVFHSRGKISRQEPEANSTIQWNTPVKVWIAN